ncbi:DUF512 domain-containing protein [Adlercreutzia sp. ZJ473]|uniref:DUF512 domain-containing protein n=1 Tax=Adlercreutzia sp. ZJ473 TaxID=2722822 RepID=UPI0015522A99
MEIYPSPDIVRQADDRPRACACDDAEVSACACGEAEASVLACACDEAEASAPADAPASASASARGSAPAPRRAARSAEPPRALITAVEPDSPAYDAGFEPGCYLTSVDGQPLRDIIDWRWLSAEDVIEVGYVDLDGDAGVVELEREEGEDWGFTFEGVVFDAVKLCRNACTFCFMRQLPAHMRPSLSLRDDDFRLSFLSGTFVTLTNLSAEDEARIIEQHISPLRVSLHASDPAARRALIGRHAQHGLDALDRLLAAGIEVHAQIVLVPEANDGDVLRGTLAWAYARPNILNVGIVPLGFTKHQAFFDHSFNDPAAARAVIDIVEPFQRRALAERGEPWVHAADEFYRNAYLADTAEKIPPTSHYGDFSLFEDGIGIIRSYVDEFDAACAGGLARRAADALDAAGLRVRYVVGEAMQPFLDRMVERSPLAGRLVPLTVRNTYFGGNVDVTGLLCACDIVPAIKEAVAENAPGMDLALARIGESASWQQSDVRGDDPMVRTKRVPHEPEAPAALPSEQDCLSDCAPSDRPLREMCGRSTFAHLRDLFVIPRVILNDAGVTLDDATVEDMEKAAGTPISVVSCNPLDYLTEIINLAAAGRAL